MAEFDFTKIDEKYHNTLDIEGFSRMLNNPSFCYKFYNILDKNMHPVYDSAKRQGYEVWNRGIAR